MEERTIVSKNERQTKKIAKNISKLIEENTVICLRGDLGAGKTTFTKYLLSYLGVKGIVSSPTFTIVKQYSVKSGIISHMDLYRLTNEEELVELGFEEMLAVSFLTIIEWPDIAIELIKNKTIDITINFNDDHNRVFNIKEKN